MKRFRYALAIAALTAAACMSAAPSATAAWDGGAFMERGSAARDGAGLIQVQSQKGRGAPERGDRGDRGDRGRDTRRERHDERRDRMSEDDRRSLHRDLDKANRELYGRRFQK